MKLIATYNKVIILQKAVQVVIIQPITCQSSSRLQQKKNISFHNNCTVNDKEGFPYVKEQAKTRSSKID